jgi:D-threo-aldose 1-dehydrogenase
MVEPFLPEQKEKRAQVVAVADEFGVDLRTASLQFAAAPSIVSAVIPEANTETGAS